MDLYAENILDHYKNPNHFGKNDHHTCSAKGNNPLCGDKFEVFLTIKDQVITEATFLGEGCAISKAGLDILLDEVIGKSREHVEIIDKESVIEMLGIDVSGGRIKCATLGLHTVKDALKNANEKV